jgi:hypothetical protein
VCVCVCVSCVGVSFNQVHKAAKALLQHLEVVASKPSKTGKTPLLNDENELIYVNVTPRKSPVPHPKAHRMYVERTAWCWLGVVVLSKRRTTPT